MNLTTQNQKKHVLSFVTVDGRIKYYAGIEGELNNGEQTYFLHKAVKFDTSKEAEKTNAKLEAYYHRQTITEISKDFWI